MLVEVGFPADLPFLFVVFFYRYVEITFRGFLRFVGLVWLKLISKAFRLVGLRFGKHLF